MTAALLSCVGVAFNAFINGGARGSFHDTPREALTACRLGFGEVDLPT